MYVAEFRLSSKKEYLSKVINKNNRVQISDFFEENGKEIFDRNPKIINYCYKNVCYICEKLV
jgi:hypothetical protein